MTHARNCENRRALGWKLTGSPVVSCQYPIKRGYVVSTYPIENFPGIKGRWIVGLLEDG
jgi:hypothetical protein